MNRFADLQASDDCFLPDSARPAQAPVSQATVRPASGIGVTTLPRTEAPHHQRMFPREMHCVRCRLVRWRDGIGLRFDAIDPASLVLYLVAVSGLRAAIIALALGHIFI